MQGGKEMNEGTGALKGLKTFSNRNEIMTSVVSRTKANITTKREMEQGRGVEDRDLDEACV